MAASSGQQLESENVEARWNITSSASQKVDHPEISDATTSHEAIGQVDHFSTSATLKVTLLADEWNSSAGGLSTINRELAIHLSEHPKVEVSLLVPEGSCKDEEKREAKSFGISVVDAEELPTYHRLQWLNFPPKDLSKVNVIVGHGVKLGQQGQVIRNFYKCKWVQVVHTAPEDLSKYKNYSDPISKGERKHQDEVDLCKLADLVVPVGPRLEEFYSCYLRRCKKDQDVFSITPGLFDREFGDLEQAPNENADFKVLIFGRGDEEDFELKGYNIAAETFTDQRLKKKPYHLIFVGAPDGKQDEVRQNLLRCGIAEEQLTVRKFIKNRDRMKDLLCEADLAIMPSKSEGFGLVALEALSAGLPILVGSKSGFAKALENVPFGKSCIVYSDDPSKWAEAIEAVRARHRMRLKEIIALRASYKTMYCLKEQCKALVERMWRMVHGSSTENDNLPKVDSPAEQKLAAETRAADCRTSEQKPLPLDEEKRDSGTNNGAASSLSNKSQSLQNWRKPIFSESSLIPDTVIKHSFQGLSDEQQAAVREILTRQIQVYMKHHNITTHDGVGGLIEHIKETHHLALKSVGVSSLVINVQCPTLKSLESLWKDYCSGHLNEVAEKYLVTDEIKRKINLETVRLKTTIEEENYLICKKALMEKTCPSNETVSVPKVESFDEKLLDEPTLGTIVYPTEISETWSLPPKQYMQERQREDITETHEQLWKRVLLRPKRSQRQRGKVEKQQNLPRGGYLPAHGYREMQQSTRNWDEEGSSIVSYEKPLPAPEDASCLRPIVIDGSSVAMSHGAQRVFSCRGIGLAVDWFLERNHRNIKVFVPSWRAESSSPESPIADQEVLKRLERDGILVWTPTRTVSDQIIEYYNDTCIVKEAAENDGVIVSNSSFRALSFERPDWKMVIEQRLLMYTFLGDKFMVLDDPLGRHGPTLDEFLKKGSGKLCPYGRRCTFGERCKFLHPERNPIKAKVVPLPPSIEHLPPKVPYGQVTTRILATKDRKYAAHKITSPSLMLRATTASTQGEFPQKMARVFPPTLAMGQEVGIGERESDPLSHGKEPSDAQLMRKQFERILREPSLQD